ncbi:MAG: ATP-binding cassette domain-containing protein [Bacilli bacterium]|nr:ATP-binding cassette domain-containing protein [Bacilli bacterium]
MLELRNIVKIYETDNFRQAALDGVTLSFKRKEIVAILGPSGCGKTTLLNIIGGLDRYTSGDLIINGKSTKNFKDSDWDSYRNNSVGFVFQSYNLINHISVIDNVEMALTLSGVSVREKRTAAIHVLERVGLKDHMYKLPSQLSGGQKQRVAIARAIVNNPDIILMDEPTGALDSKTSVQILDLIKEISKDNLVLIVTHNPTLAEEYSDRIVKLYDGKVIDDSKPALIEPSSLVYSPKKTAMSFWTALKLSFNNLKTKLIRSLITTLAASIGIIGVALVLSISNGFGNQVDKLQKESLSGMPLTVSQYSFNFDMQTFQNMQNQESPEPNDFVYPYDPASSRIPIRENKITADYIDYIRAMDSSLYQSISFGYDASMFNLLTNYSGVKAVDAEDLNWSVLPSSTEYLLTQFEIISGEMPKEATDVVLIVDEQHRINQNILLDLGIPVLEQIEYSSIIGKELASARNNDFYTYDGAKYQVVSDLTTAYNAGIKLEIVGILRGTNQVSSLLLGEGIAYDSRLNDLVFSQSLTSNIVLAQQAADTNVKTGLAFNPFVFGDTKENTLKSIGGLEIPDNISIYAGDFNQKEELKEYLNAYNTDKEEIDQIVYSDLAEQFTGIMSSLVNGISIVLIAFAAISLVVSSIMIGIITYVSVLERTKEIGVLRSLGARKKDITRVFNAETMMIGFAAGVFGVVVTALLNIPLDQYLTSAVQNMENIADLSPTHAILLVVVSVILTLISGLIPASIAAKKDPVEALRVES